MKISFYSLLVLSFLFVQQMNATEKINVHIVDGIKKNKPQLIFRCASGDDDLGWHFPTYQGSDFQFSFKLNFFVETIFFCHFWWGKKDVSFEVYRNSGACGSEIHTGICYWLVKEDGFYLANQTSPPPSFLVRKFGWENAIY
ncbi:putative F-box/kelch-repeat protein-like [Capsicum annuum]|nr:putative F-box/kelch-repeat protein-like [Capsicum annuum]